LPRGHFIQVLRRVSFLFANQYDLSDSSGQKHYKYSGSNIKNRKACAFTGVVYDLDGKAEKMDKKFRGQSIKRLLAYWKLYTHWAGFRRCLG